MSSGMTSKTGSSGDDLALKFLFANQDGVNVVLKFPKSTFVSAVKADLARNWPQGVTPPEDHKSVRLICMGRGLLQDHQTLDGCKVPAFPTHPTPVNVSVLRKAPSTTRDFPQTVAAKSVAASGCGCVLQ
uniref:UBL3-like ubiquitin domain-containing protein n=1 Tax=Globisporangium ultimum (strain ATCC 200006 / CBS 805.95 / DAOM BR144) TaxID=431595 RepID=K3WIF4_GLOUD